MDTFGSSKFMGILYKMFRLEGKQQILNATVSPIILIFIVFKVLLYVKMLSFYTKTVTLFSSFCKDCYPEAKQKYFRINFHF